MTPAFSHWQNYWAKQRSIRKGDGETKISLRLLLVALFVLLTLGTVGVVQFLWMENGQRAAQELANRLMDDVGGRASLYLDHYLQTPQQVNRLNADAVALGELDLQNLPALEQHFVTRLKQFESLSSVQVGNSRNDFRLVTREDGWRLLQANAANPTQIEEYAIDGAGRKRERLGTNQATIVHNQLWYQTALFNSKPTWGVISKSVTEIYRSLQLNLFTIRKDK